MKNITNICVIPGVPWTKVFAHDVSGGLFTSGADALSKNPENPEANLFSVLSQLDTLRLEDGTFHLKLCYPELGKCNDWTQTSNPATSSDIQNFRAIELGFPKKDNGKPFNGIGVNPASASKTLIDDTPNRGAWWYAIGAMAWHPAPGTIPGPFGQTGPGMVVKQVELFAETPGILPLNSQRSKKNSK